MKTAMRRKARIPRMTMKAKHGGARAGAGRKPGKRSASRSVSLPLKLWRRIDLERNGLSVSAWIRKAIEKGGTS